MLPGKSKQEVAAASDFLSESLAENRQERHVCRTQRGKVEITGKV
jgi:hypothetical protein